MSIIRLIEDIVDETIDIWQDAKHDWRFAKRQMNTIQGKSLYKGED